MTYLHPDLMTVLLDDLVKLKQRAQMEDWDIQIEAASGEIHGEVHVVPEYKKAIIYIHPDTDDLSGTLLHEFVHVILWEFSTYANMLVKSSLEEECMRMGEERLVILIERVLGWRELP